MRNVSHVVKLNLCIGCGICEVACPNNAIKMVFDIKKWGVPVPIVNEVKCNNCQKCLYVCYGHKLDSMMDLKIFGKHTNSILGNVINCYVGYATDKKLRFDSTSGGAITALLCYALNQGLIDGAIVTHVEAGNPPKIKAFLATTTDEIRQAVGSKYCPVSFADAFKKMESSKSYAVVGLPCHIYSIRKLAESNKKVRETISLFFGILCGGMPDFFGTLYILRKCRLEEKYIEELEYRGGGWPGRFLVKARINKDKIAKVQAPYPEYWYDAFGFFIPHRCTLCNDGFNWFSDASFGDAWLPELKKVDNMGTSLIITRTPIGEKLVRSAVENGVIQVSPVSSLDAMKAQTGLVHFKFSTIIARVNLCKKLKKALPLADIVYGEPVNFKDYLVGLWFYFGNSLAHKRKFWWLFNAYATINSFLNAAKICLNRYLKI